MCSFCFCLAAQFNTDVGVESDRCGVSESMQRPFSMKDDRLCAIYRNYRSKRTGFAKSRPLCRICVGRVAQPDRLPGYVYRVALNLLFYSFGWC
jgi:hypothetical protein